MHLIKKFSSTQTVLVLIGGHAQRLLPFVRLLFPEVTHVLVIDAHDELLRLGSSAKSFDVQLFPIGVRQTAQTLTINSPKKLQKYLASVGGMDANGGLGQALAVGHAAAETLVASPEFQEFIRRTLLPKARTRSGGDLRKVRLIFAGSLAGGTFAGAVLAIAQALTKQFLDLTSATLSVEFLATGGLTYEGLGDRTWSNAAVALAQLLAYVTDPKRHAREARRVRLLEFEVLGRNEPLRDAYLAQVEQAAHCEWMRFDSQRREPNDSLNGRFGNAQTWEIEFGNALDPSRDIAAVANQVYGVPIRDALNRRPGDNALVTIVLEHQRVRLNNESVDAILEDAAERVAEHVVAELRSPSYRNDVQGYVQVSANERIAFTDLETLWAVAPKNCSEADERLQFQRRLLELLGAEASELTERRQRAEAETEVEIANYFRIHQRLNPVGIAERFLSAFSSTASLCKQLAYSAVRIRELSDQHAELSAEEAAVDKAWAFVKQANDYLHAKLTRIDEALKKAGPPLGNELPKVSLYSLDQQFSDLWNAVDENAEAFLDAIRRSAQHATLAGLAKVTGANCSEVEEIAKRILSGDAYETPAVPWGGRSRADQGRTMHVLPPLAPDHQRLVSEAALRRNPEANLAFADRSPVVVNVVSVTMRLVRSLGDVLTEPYLLGLKEALNSECPDIFLPEQDATLASLGITIRDGEILLPTE